MKKEYQIMARYKANPHIEHRLTFTNQPTVYIAKGSFLSHPPTEKEIDAFVQNLYEEKKIKMPEGVFYPIVLEAWVKEVYRDFKRNPNSLTNEEKRELAQYLAGSAEYFSKEGLIESDQITGREDWD